MIYYPIYSTLLQIVDAGVHLTHFSRHNPDHKSALGPPFQDIYKLSACQ